MPQNPYFRYLAPLMAYLLLGAVQNAMRQPELFWLLYTVKIAVTAAVFALVFAKRWQEIPGKPDSLSIMTGVAVLAVWLAHYWFFSPHKAPAFDPDVLPPSL